MRYAVRTRSITLADDPNPMIKLAEAAIVVLPVSYSLFSRAGIDLIYASLGALSLLGPRAALLAMISVMLVRAANSGLVGGDQAGSLLSWVALAMASSRLIIAWALRPHISSPVIGFICFVIVGVTISGAISVEPALSYYKFAIWTLVILGLLLVNTNSHYAREFTRGFHSRALDLLTATLVILSIPTLASPDVGYGRNEVGFQGILNHPQAFGTILAPLLAWQVTRSIGDPSLRSKWRIAGLALTSIFVIMSLARTAIGAVALAILTCGLLALFVREDWLQSLKILTKPIVLGSAVLLFLFALPFLDELLVPVLSFFQKHEQGATIYYSLLESRRGLVELMFQNIAENPWFGIGFGVPSTFTDFTIEYDARFGLPIGAAIEKGNAFIAIVEEIGAIGAIAFVVMLAVFARHVVLFASLPAAMLFFTALWVNLGEAVLFSLGGVGLSIWIYFCIALCDAMPGRKGV